MEYKNEKKEAKEQKKIVRDGMRWWVCKKEQKKYLI